MSVHIKNRTLEHSVNLNIKNLLDSQLNHSINWLFIAFSLQFRVCIKEWNTIGCVVQGFETQIGLYGPTGKIVNVSQSRFFKLKNRSMQKKNGNRSNRGSIARFLEPWSNCFSRFPLNLNHKKKKKKKKQKTQKNKRKRNTTVGKNKPI